MGLFADNMSIRSLVSLSGRSCRIASVATTTAPATTGTTNTINTSVNNFKGNNATTTLTNNSNSKSNEQQQQQQHNQPKLSQPSLSSNSSTLSSDNASIMNPNNIRKLQKNNNKGSNGSSSSSNSSNNSNSSKNKTGILPECAIAIATTTAATSATSKVNNNNHNHHHNHHHHHHHKGSSFVFTSTKRDAFEKNHHYHYREGNDSSDSNSMQQLSTSWEFIKLGERPIPADVSIVSNDKGNKSKITQQQQQQQQQQQDSTTAPRYITITDGKILLGPPEPAKLVTSTTTATATTPLSPSGSSSSNMQSYDNNTKENKKVITRVAELEEALNRLQDNRINNGHCQSPILEKNLKKQLKNTIKSTIVSEEKKIVHECKDHKMLQARFTRQENLLYLMQQENKNLKQRIRQYEHCLDDVIRKVVDAIVAEDSLREEVTILKSRVRDLEAQNAALYAKGRDEGYCTMNTVQPQLSNSHLEDLLEEPEQWLLTSSSSDNNTTDMILYNEINDCDDDDDNNVAIGEPTTSCSAADMEDWSMSQEELNVITLNSDLSHRELDWIWNSNIMMDSQSEDITKLLQETIIYSEDEEISCIDFTKDFYKLVSIPSGSTKSLYSHVDTETDNDGDDDDGDDNGENDNNDEENKTNSDKNSSQQININLKVNDEDKKNHLIPSEVTSTSEITQIDICSTTRATTTENNNDIVQSTIHNYHRHTDTSIARSSVQCVKNKVKSLNRKLLSTVGINYEVNENRNSVHNSDCGTAAAAANKQSSISADLIKHQRVHPLKKIATNPTATKPITTATTAKSKVMTVSPPATVTQSKIQAPSVPIKW